MRAGRPIALLALAVLLVACGTSDPPEAGRRLRVLAPDGFPVPAAAVDAFVAETGVPVAVLRVADGAAAVDEMQVGAEHAAADLVLGPDPTDLAPLVLDNALLSPLTPSAELLAGVDPRLLNGFDGRAVPVRKRDACFVVHRDLVDEERIPRRVDVEGLFAALDEGELVIPDPETSSAGRWLLMALAGSDPGNPAILSARLSELLGETPVVAPDLAAVVFQELRSSGRPTGPPAAFATAALPAAVEMLRDPAPEHPSLYVVPDRCIRVADYAVLPRDGTEPELATRFVELLLAPESQEAMVDGLGNEPVSTQVDLGPDWNRLVGRAVLPIVLDPVIVATRMDGWLTTWQNPPEPAVPEEPDDASSSTTGG